MKRHTFLVKFMFAAVCLTLLGKTLGSASGGESQQFAAGAQDTSTRVVVHSAGRGRPYVNFEDGIDAPAAYVGPPEIQSLLKDNAVESRSLASADFDEDGVPDLVCGYPRPGGGIITLYRGNVDSIFPNNPEAQQRKAKGGFTGSAFLSPARVKPKRQAGYARFQRAGNHGVVECL